MQGELETALTRLAGEARIRVDGAGGRTPGSMRAGQVIAFTYAAGSGRTSWSRRSGALLPPDIGLGTLWRVQPTSGRATRRSAGSTATRSGTGLAARCASATRSGPGAAGCRGDGRAAQVFVGRHDFSAFGGRDRQPVRTLHGVRVRRTGRMVTIEVVGDAFLRQMVRRIVAALLRVGRGEATAEDLEAALRSPGRAFAGEIAPPHGLCLRRVVLGRRRDRDRKSDDQDIHAASSRRSSASWFVVDADGQRSDGSPRASPACSRASTSRPTPRTSTPAIT